MNIDFKKYRHVPKISSSIIIVSFLLPFFLIKCGGQTLAEVRGIDMLVGMDIKTSSEAKHLTWSLFGIVTALCAVAALVLALLDKKSQKLLSLVIACVGLACLIMMAIQMKMAVGMETEAMITVGLGFGFYLAFIGFLVNSLFFGLSMKEDKNSETPKTFESNEDVI